MPANFGDPDNTFDTHMRDTLVSAGAVPPQTTHYKLGLPARNPDTGYVVILGGSQSKRKQFSESLDMLGHKHIGLTFIPYPIPDVAHYSDLSPGTPSAPLDHVIGLLRDKLVLGVIPLVDSASAFADILTDRLGIPGNSPLTTQYRIDKDSMHEALRRAKLRHIRSYRVYSMRGAMAIWKSKLGGCPVVMKPPTSGGGDGVEICSSRSDIRNYMSRYLHEVNFERNVNTTLVMQELVDSSFNTEYIVNTVSLGRGHHFVTDVWMSSGLKRSDGSRFFIYNEQELVYDWPAQLIQYTLSVLDTVGMVHGASHIELLAKRDSNGVVIDCVLVEINPRVAGEVRTMNIPGWPRYDQIYWLLASVIDKRDCVLRMKATIPLPPSFAAIAIFLISKVNGKIDPTCLVRIRVELKSFVMFGRGLRDLNEKTNEEIMHKKINCNKTVNLLTSPGVVLLAGPNARIDANIIRLWESSNSMYH